MFGYDNIVEFCWDKWANTTPKAGEWVSGIGNVDKT